MLYNSFTSHVIHFILLTLTASVTHCHENHDQTSCGIDKVCFTMPPDCLSQPGRTCDMLFTIATDASGRFAAMQLTAKPDASSSPDASRWFAAGFSDDGVMGDDAVFECLQLATGAVDLRLSYNSGKSNRVVGDSPQSSNVHTVMRNGMISCSWHQALPFTVRGNTYDLIKNKYHLMLAKGAFRSASIKAYHTDRIVSSEKIDLASVSSSNSEGVSGGSAGSASSSAGQQPIFLIKAHGIIMTCAWLVIASAGIMIARHYKYAFSGSTCCGVQLWFFVSITFSLCPTCCVVVRSWRK